MQRIRGFMNERVDDKEVENEERVRKSKKGGGENEKKS